MGKVCQIAVNAGYQGKTGTYYTTPGKEGRELRFQSNDPNPKNITNEKLGILTQKNFNTNGGLDPSKEKIVAKGPEGTFYIKMNNRGEFIPMLLNALDGIKNNKSELRLKTSGENPRDILIAPEVMNCKPGVYPVF